MKGNEIVESARQFLREQNEDQQNYNCNSPELDIELRDLDKINN